MDGGTEPASSSFLLRALVYRAPPSLSRRRAMVAIRVFLRRSRSAKLCRGLGLAIRARNQAAPAEPTRSSPQTTTANLSSASADVDTGPESTGGPMSAGERQAAMSNGLRWNMIGRPVIEAANLLAVAVLARLVAPAEFGRYTIALIVLLLATVPTWRSTTRSCSATRLIATT